MSTCSPEYVKIQGSCNARFAALEAEFQKNFSERGEVGAAVCVYQNGRLVADLWGGFKDAGRQNPWSQDTIVNMHSVGKGMASLCLLRLVDRGAVDLSAPVARYWPEFAQAGKHAITVEQVMSGQAALVFLDHASPGDYFHREAMVRAIERQEPAWPPGTRGAYHSATYGTLIGELVRRADGRLIGQFFADEIASPLGADFHPLLSEPDLARVADVIVNPLNTTVKAQVDSSEKLGRAWRALPPGARDFNSRRFRTHLLEGGGHGNAAGVARIYAALANHGEIDGVRILSPTLIDRARTEQWAGICGLTDRPFRYALGFFLSSSPAAYMGPNPRTFGHPGIGGAMGFADPDANVSFGYSPNFMCEGSTLGERCAALVDALYACLTKP